MKSFRLQPVAKSKPLTDDQKAVRKEIAVTTAKLAVLTPVLLILGAAVVIGIVVLFLWVRFWAGTLHGFSGPGW